MSAGSLTADFTVPLFGPTFGPNGRAGSGSCPN